MPRGDNLRDPRRGPGECTPCPAHTLAVTIAIAVAVAAATSPHHDVFNAICISFDARASASSSATRPRQWVRTCVLVLLVCTNPACVATHQSGTITHMLLSQAAYQCTVQNERMVLSLFV